jgi:hypothetical protein
MRLSAYLGLLCTAIVPVFAAGAAQEDSVSTYLQNGWEIKAVSQISSVGYTQIILQNGRRGVVCTIYYSVRDNGWISKGCDPLP